MENIKDGAGEFCKSNFTIVDSHCHLTFSGFSEFLSGRLGDKSKEYYSVEKLIERAKGKYPSGNQKEGIVIRPVVTTHSKILNGPLSMKVLNNDYLLKDN